MELRNLSHFLNLGPTSNLLQKLGLRLPYLEKASCQLRFTYVRLAYLQGTRRASLGALEDHLRL